MSRATQPTIASDRGRTVETANAAKHAALSVRGLTVAYSEKPAIFSVDATFEADGMSAIVGPNGAGKTTVFNCLTGFYKPTVGRLTMMRNGRPWLLEQL
ncbi:MAG: ATP-binding cassette domain-containing protein, partial [Alphaproteobacteria bacterium]